MFIYMVLNIQFLTSTRCVFTSFDANLNNLLNDDFSNAVVIITIVIVVLEAEPQTIVFEEKQQVL